jgi:hypothetical protein
MSAQRVDATPSSALIRHCLRGERSVWLYSVKTSPGQNPTALDQTVKIKRPTDGALGDIKAGRKCLRSCPNASAAQASLEFLQQPHICLEGLLVKSEMEPVRRCGDVA